MSPATRLSVAESKHRESLFGMDKLGYHPGMLLDRFRYNGLLRRPLRVIKKDCATRLQVP